MLSLVLQFVSGNSVCLRLKTKQQQVDLSGGHWRSRCLHHRWQRLWLSVKVTVLPTKPPADWFCSEPCGQYYQPAMAGPFLPDDLLLATEWRSVGVMIVLMHFEPKFLVVFVSEELYRKRKFCLSVSVSIWFLLQELQQDISTRFLCHIAPSHAADDDSQTDFSLSLLFLDYQWQRGRGYDDGGVLVQLSVKFTCSHCACRPPLMTVGLTADSNWSEWLVQSEAPPLTFWQTNSPRWALIKYAWIEEELLVMSHTDLYQYPDIVQPLIFNTDINRYW